MCQGVSVFQELWDCKTFVEWSCVNETILGHLLKHNHWKICSENLHVFNILMIKQKYY